VSVSKRRAQPASPPATVDHRDVRRREGLGRVTFEVSAPRQLTATGSGAVLSNSLLITGLVSGHIPATPALVWPLVALSIASMAYDLGRKALTRDRL
jgi:hypothetical protein